MSELPCNLEGVDLTGEASGLVIRPGDTLVLHYKRALSVDLADAIKRRVNALLPDLAQVVIISGADGVAAYRPEADS